MIDQINPAVPFDFAPPERAHLRIGFVPLTDCAPLDVRFAKIDDQMLVVDGRPPIAAEHWRLSGEVERDLWFDPRGILVKAAFQRRGFPIEVILTKG